MIEASAAPFAGITRLLTRRARAIAAAHVESLVRARRRDPGRWRDARLLWPNSTQEP